MAKATRAGKKSGAGEGKGGAEPPTRPTLAEVVQRALSAMEVAEAELDAQELSAYTADERLHSSGKLREGEPDAMLCVLDTVDKHPGQFASLAPADHGKDDKLVETGPAREALARRALLAPLAAKLSSLATRVGDDVLASSALARDVTVPAYAIIKANAPINPALRKSASKALDFFAAKRKKASKG